MASLFCAAKRMQYQTVQCARRVPNSKARATSVLQNVQQGLSGITVALRSSRTYIWGSGVLSADYRKSIRSIHTAANRLRLGTTDMADKVAARL